MEEVQISKFKATCLAVLDRVGKTRVPVLVTRFGKHGHERTNFPVLAHTLPPSTSIDGILGSDYLRGARLSIDFRTGFLTLT